VYCRWAAGFKAVMDAAFKKFASKANGAEATSMDINKWAKDAGVLGKNLTSNHIDIAYSKVKAKGAKYVHCAEVIIITDSNFHQLFCRHSVDSKLS